MNWSGLPKYLDNNIIPEPNSGCWIWLGGLRSKEDGYGGAMWKGKSWRTHRLVYTLLCEKVPAELDIDHVCRNRICCNPDHLEPVTRKVNIHRGEGIAAKNLAKTHCAKGHEYNAENTYNWNNQRFCRTCSNGWKTSYARWHSKNKEREAAYDQWDPLTG